MVSGDNKPEKNICRLCHTHYFPPTKAELCSHYNRSKPPTRAGVTVCTGKLGSWPKQPEYAF